MKRKNFLHYYTKPHLRLLFRWVDLRKVHLIKKTIHDKNKKILDLGSGDSNVLTAAGFSKFFVGDINKDLVLACKKKNPSTQGICLNCDVVLPFKDKSFDIITMIDSIEHMKYPHHIVSEVKRVLNQDGIFIVFTPPYDSLSWTIGEKIHKFITRGPLDHITPFTRESLEYHLKNQFNEVMIGRLNMGLTMFGIAKD